MWRRTTLPGPALRFKARSRRRVTPTTLPYSERLSGIVIGRSVLCTVGVPGGSMKAKAAKVVGFYMEEDKPAICSNWQAGFTLPWVSPVNCQDPRSNPARSISRSSTPHGSVCFSTPRKAPACQLLLKFIINFCSNCRRPRALPSPVPAVADPAHFLLPFWLDRRPCGAALVL